MSSGRDSSLRRRSAYRAASFPALAPTTAPSSEAAPATLGTSYVRSPDAGAWGHSISRIAILPPASALSRSAEETDAPGDATSAVDHALNGGSGGQPLDRETRSYLEPRFGHDFSQVRVHTDARAEQSAQAVQAHAYAVGNDIVFGSGQYQPGTSAGRRLLAHELTHVVQQGGASPATVGRKCAECEEEEKQAAGAQGVEGQEDDNPFSQTVIAARTSAPTVQRVATWGAAGTVHEANNLANVILNGGAAGLTLPTLNGSNLMSTAASRSAIKAPTLAFASSASGGVEATVATVPTNTGSFDETVLAAGPWTVAATKAAVGGKFASLTACTGAGNSTFRAIGKPTDAAMFAANRRHEDHHAADHHTSFDNSIGQWDTKLTAAKAAGTKFTGPAESDAQAALFAAMGGTTDQVADAYFNACLAAGAAFHATPTGGTIKVSNPASNADCTTSSVDATNPS